MSFTDGQSQLKQGRVIRAIDFTPGAAADDQKMLIWDNPSNSFKLIAQPVAGITSASFVITSGFQSGSFDNTAVNVFYGFGDLLNSGLKKTEANARQKFPLACHLTRLIANVSVNSGNAVTIGVRQNGASAASLAVGNATGEFDSGVLNIAIAAGDELCWFTNANGSLVGGVVYAQFSFP